MLACRRYFPIGCWGGLRLLKGGETMKRWQWIVDRLQIAALALVVVGAALLISGAIGFVLMQGLPQ